MSTGTYKLLLGPEQKLFESWSQNWNNKLNNAANVKVSFEARRILLLSMDCVLERLMTEEGARHTVKMSSMTS